MLFVSCMELKSFSLISKAENTFSNAKQCPVWQECCDLFETHGTEFHNVETNVTMTCIVMIDWRVEKIAMDTRRQFVQKEWTIFWQRKAGLSSLIVMSWQSLQLKIWFLEEENNTTNKQFSMFLDCQHLMTRRHPRMPNIDKMWQLWVKLSIQLWKQNKHLFLSLSEHVG